MIDPETLTAFTSTGPATAALDAAQAAGKLLLDRHRLPAYVPPPGRSDESRCSDQVAASLAGGMIAASGKAHTAEEAVAIWRGVREVLAA